MQPRSRIAAGVFSDGDLAPARQHRRHFDGDIQAL
jgi:hypothetical protein